jgi:hypothetical protein
VKNKGRAITHFLIAALLVWSAAICAVAQSKASKKNNKSEPQATAPTPPKQNSRDAINSQSANDAATKPIPTEARTASPSSNNKSVAASVKYSYEFTQPNFLVSRIFIEHDTNGRGQITFERKNSDPITDPLDLSGVTVARLKTLWDALHFLDSQQSYQSEKQYPHLGTNSLRMTEGTRDRLAEFNWTGDKDAFALVTEYKRIANQAIFLFDIALARENQPLESPKLMDEFDDYLRRNEIADPQQLLPLLRELSTDERLPLIARNHAARIVKKIEK